MNWKALNWENILSRAAWTFAQAFIGSFTAVIVWGDLSTLKTAGLAGVTAGLGALLSFVKTVITEQLAVE